MTFPTSLPRLGDTACIPPAFCASIAHPDSLGSVQSREKPVQHTREGLSLTRSGWDCSAHSTEKYIITIATRPTRLLTSQTLASLAFDRLEEACLAERLRCSLRSYDASLSRGEKVIRFFCKVQHRRTCAPHQTGLTPPEARNRPCAKVR